MIEVCYCSPVQPSRLIGSGRPWTVEELRHKSWEDLHSLWYKCCLERNRLATEAKERKRMQLVNGNIHVRARDVTVGASSNRGCLGMTC